MREPDGYPGDDLINHANAFLELLAHPVIRTTLAMNQHNMTDLSDMTFGLVSKTLADQARRRREHHGTDAAT